MKKIFQSFDSENLTEEQALDDIYAELNCFFECHEKAPYGVLLIGEIQGWNRNENRKGKQIFNSFASLWGFISKDCDFYEITDDNGRLFIRASHHDGTNTGEVRIVTEKLADLWESWLIGEISVISHKEFLENSLQPNFAQYLQGLTKILCS